MTVEYTQPRPGQPSAAVVDGQRRTLIAQMPEDDVLIQVGHAASAHQVAIHVEDAAEFVTGFSRVAGLNPPTGEACDSWAKVKACMDGLETGAKVAAGQEILARLEEAMVYDEPAAKIHLDEALLIVREVCGIGGES